MQSDDMSTKTETKKFYEDGLLVIENFATDEEMEEMRAECHELVEKMNPAEHQTVFSTTKQNYRDDYFIKSADRISYFYEDGAIDEKGNLTVDKHKSLNKIGHAMHILCPAFKKFTFSDKVKNLLKNLEYTDPVVMQSMYIFKQPNIGGEVVPHQDASYLYCTPVKVVGLWLALEDATLENGCLWYIPGSHKNGLKGDYRMIRNPKPETCSCIYVGEKPSYDDDKFVPAPVKKGSLVLIHGLVVHKSEKNLSDKSRHIYTFHVYDNGTSTWSKENWLQPTEANTFCHIYEVKV